MVLIVQRDARCMGCCIMIKYEVTGSTHGAGYSGSISGLPSGVAIDTDAINRELSLRKCGIGRSSRQDIEIDTVTLTGLDNGITTGSTVCFEVANTKHAKRDNITALRSGHIDVVVANAYGIDTVREHNEQASARSSVGYVVVGSIVRQCLAQYGITLYSHTLSIGGVVADIANNTISSDSCPLLCSDSIAVEKMTKAIDNARELGNSLGGIVRIVAHGVPMGLGFHTPYSRRLDGIIAGALMSIPSVKGVSFGMGCEYANSTGVACVDKLALDNNNNIVYSTNNCGGIVGGMTTGGDIVAELVVKPVPTVRGADTIDSVTHEVVPAHFERADTCVVPNVGVIARNMLAICLLDSITNKG